VSHLLSAIETIGEEPEVKHGTLCIRLATSEAVDAFYARLGEPEKGRFEAPYDDYTLDGMAWERRAVTTVAGVTVVITGPINLT
jgi:hypothetical protein